MKLGISANPGRSDLSDFGAELDRCEALGVDSIELAIYDFDIVAGGRILPGQLARAKAVCAGRSVAYSAHGPLGINFMDETWRVERHFGVLRASLDVAAELGAKHYVLHAGLTPAGQRAALADARARQLPWLARTAEEAAARGLVVCVETLFAGYDGKLVTATPRELAADLEAVGHPSLRATLDFSHAAINLNYRGGDLVAECAALAPLADHLHVHDSFGLQDDIWLYTAGERLAFGHGDLHLPVGWGDLPWAALMQACQLPGHAVFNIELEPRWWHAAEECVAATRGLMAQARRRHAA